MTEAEIKRNIEVITKTIEWLEEKKEYLHQELDKVETINED